MTDPKAYYSAAYTSLKGGHGRSPSDEPTFNQRVSAALDVLRKGGPQNVLDFGCGAGDAVGRFLLEGHNVTGVDISPVGIELAKQRVPNATFLAVDGETQLPFCDSTFDACFSSEVIEHLLDVTSFLREVRRVLRPGGTLMLTTPFHGLAKNLALVVLAFDRHFNVEGEHIRFFSRESLESLLLREGFETESFKGIGRFPFLWKTMFISARRIGS